MLNIDAIAKAIDFVEARLREDIAVSDMAAAISYSLYHFCRTFNMITHFTPYDYLIRRRLAESARDLLQTDKKIIDIACDYQFNNPETFSRAFKRVFGLQPKQWRKQGNLDPRLIMPRLTVAHLAHLGKGAYLNPVLEERPVTHITGVITLVKDDPKVVLELREWFSREQRGANESLPRELYEVRIYPREWEIYGFFYLIGVEVGDPTTLKTTHIVKSIPGGKYARFTHKGRDEEVQLSLDYIFHTWLPQSGQSLAFPLVVTSHGGKIENSPESECKVFIPIKESSEMSSHPG